MQQKPTSKQAAFLDARGITVPSSRNQAWRLIAFVKFGYPGGLPREDQRVALIKWYQDKFLGKRVYDAGCKRFGAVVGISARLAEEKTEVHSLEKGMLIVVQFMPPGRKVTTSVTPASLTILD